MAVVTNEEHDVATVADYWSAEGVVESFSGATYWLGHPRVSERYHRKATGGRGSVHWVDYTIHYFLAERGPVGRLLSVGCGDGDLERHLMVGKAAREIDAIDIAPARIARARAAAAAQGLDAIHYSVANAETDEFPRPRYDAVVFDSSLHHIDDLEGVLARTARCLAPGGLLILNEYVGPRRFALSRREKEVIRACFDLLPERFRVSLEPETRGQIMDSPAIPDPDEVKRVDPSESIRSDEILPLIEERFEIVELNPVGGTVLNFLLARIAGNFAETDPVADALLEVFFRIEDALLAAGELDSHFVFLVARNPGGAS